MKLQSGLDCQVGLGLEHLLIDGLQGTIFGLGLHRNWKEACNPNSCAILIFDLRLQPLICSQQLLAAPSWRLQHDANFSKPKKHMQAVPLQMSRETGVSASAHFCRRQNTT